MPRYPRGYINSRVQKPRDEENKEEACWVTNVGLFSQPQYISYKGLDGHRRFSSVTQMPYSTEMQYPD